MFPIRSLLLALCGFLMLSSAQAAVITIDFDSLVGMDDIPGSSVPDASRLSSGFLSLGASF